MGFNPQSGVSGSRGALILPRVQRHSVLGGSGEKPSLDRQPNPCADAGTISPAAAYGRLSWPYSGAAVCAKLSLRVTT